MKRRISVVLCVLLAVIYLAVPIISARAESLTVTGIPNSIEVGKEFTVSISVPKNIGGTVFIEYSKEALKVKNSPGADVGTGSTSYTAFFNSSTESVTFEAIAVPTENAYVNVYMVDAEYSDVEPSVSVPTVEKYSKSFSVTAKAKSGDNSLKSLKVSNAKLSPTFKSNVTKYTTSVDYSIKSVIITAETSHREAQLVSTTINGNPVNSGAPINLNVGDNKVELVIKAANGSKATYTIVVTRKAQESTPVTPPEVDTPPTSEITPPEVNEMLQWNGEQLQPVETIPQESIPANFESTLLVVNGQQLQGLTFTKGDLKVLYLNNTNGAGSLYVYDEAQQTIYPFIKLISEKGHVIMLLPDEQNAPAPEGFENCTFSIEGKGLVSAYQLKEDIASEESEVNIRDFYLIYCMNDAGEKGWYMYDSIEGTYQRYIPIVPSVQTGSDDVVDTDLESKYTALEKELNTAKMTQYIILAIAAAVIFILLIVIIVLAVKGRKKKDDSFEDEKANQNEESENQEIRDAAVAEEILAIEEALVMEKTLDKEEEEDEFEIEFYEIEEQIEEPVEEPEIPVDNQEEVEVKDEPEFLDLENAILDAIQEAQKEVEPEQEPEIKIVRKPKATDLTSKLSSEKEADDDDLVFIDFD